MSDVDYAGHRRAAKVIKLRPKKRAKAEPSALLGAAGKSIQSPAEGPTDAGVRNLLLDVCKLRMSRYCKVEVDVSVSASEGERIEPADGAGVAKLGLPAWRARASTTVRDGELRCWRKFRTWLESDLQG